MLTSFYKTTLGLVLILGLSGCDVSSTDAEQNATAFSFADHEYSQLMGDLLVLQEAISLDQVLKSSPKRFLVLIDGAIMQARSGLLLLAKTGEKSLEDKRKAHAAFVNSIRQFESFRVLEIEQERFDRVFNQVRYLRYELGQELGIDQDQETWTIFNHNFSTSGLEPTFTTMGFSKTGKPNDEARWFTNFQTDLPKARAQGRDGSYGWMISRPFDLSEVENPSFRYFGSYLVVAPNNVLSLAEVITSVFKTYILLGYEPGDNPETYSDDRKILVQYDLDQLPLGRDFDDSWVPFVSLTPYKDQTIAIGFLFDTRGINFTQYYSWTVFDFELNGRGKIKEDPVKYKEQFSGSNLGGYKSYSLEFPGVEWTADSKAKISFTPTADNVGDNVDTYLLSPKLDVPKGLSSPTLQIKESFLNDHFSLDNLKDFEILVSKDFKGGTSPENVQWEKLERVIEDNTLVTSDKTTSMTHLFSLDKYLDEEIVLAFRFKATEAAQKTLDWSIDSIQISGEGGKVTAIDYVLQNSSESYRLAYFDFAASAVKSFVVESEEGAPQWQKKANGFMITGFGGPGNPNLFGGSRLILPSVNLTDKSDARMRLNQKVFYFRDGTVSEQVVRIDIRKKGEEAWTKLELPAGTVRDGMPRDPELSSWIRIPKEYLGSEIELSLWYKALNGNGGTVEWTFSSIEVGSK